MSRNGFAQNLPLWQNAKREISLFWTFQTWHVCVWPLFTQSTKLFRAYVIDIQQKNKASCKRGSRGGDRGSGPPWDLSEVGSCVEAWRAGEGVHGLFLPYYYLFFLARFAHEYYTNILHVFIFPSSMFSMERSSFLYISLVQIMKKNPTFHPFFLWKGIFIFMSKITRFYTI